MKIVERPALTDLNTFGVNATAALQFEIESEEDILALPTFNPDRDLLLGGGSNVLLVSDVPGNVLLNRIPGRHVVDLNDDSAVVEVGSGENWHELVGWTLEQGYSGLENLALIPGSVGAAPVQNIGAYGVELESRVESVTAWDLEQDAWRVFSAPDCQFAYRDSRFKSKHPNRFLITSLRFSLDRTFVPQLMYRDLREELSEHAEGHLTARDVYNAVVQIRTRKLPDPKKIGNAGSFFKNPVMDSEQAAALKRSHPDIPSWTVGSGMTKLSAAWMIEYCGLKGYKSGSAGVSEQHALVLVNLGDASGAQIWAVAEHVRDIVAREFDIKLEPEPKIVNYQS